MIKDNNQLAYTKELASKFEDANQKLRVNEEKQHLDPDGWQLIQNSNEALRQKLISEIKEYEALIAHHPSQPLVLEIDDINYLPDAVITALSAVM
jgi:selenocysteine lyase/cysteine desulfurase